MRGSHQDNKVPKAFSGPGPDGDRHSHEDSGDGQARRVEHRAAVGPVHLPQPPVHRLRAALIQPVRTAQEH